MFQRNTKSRIWRSTTHQIKLTSHKIIKKSKFHLECSLIYLRKFALHPCHHVATFFVPPFTFLLYFYQQFQLSIFFFKLLPQHSNILIQTCNFHKLSSFEIHSKLNSFHSKFDSKSKSIPWINSIPNFNPTSQFEIDLLPRISKRCLTILLTQFNVFDDNNIATYNCTKINAGLVVVAIFACFSKKMQILERKRKN